MALPTGKEARLCWTRETSNWTAGLLGWDRHLQRAQHPAQLLYLMAAIRGQRGRPVSVSGLDVLGDYS